MWTSPIPIHLSHDLAAAGKRRDYLSRRARPPSNDLIRLLRGAYVQRQDLEGLSHARAHEVSIHAARLTGLLTEGAVLARESAAVMLGIPLVGALPHQVQVVRRGRDGGRSTPGVRTLRASGDYQSLTRDGVEISSVAQTLADLARRRPLWSVLPGLDAMLRSGQVTKDQITSLASPGSHGRTRLLHAVAVADPASESVGESLSRAVMIEENVPLPELQETVRSAQGEFLGRVDFIWPQAGVIGEFDGHVKYSGQLTGRNLDTVLLDERRREIDIERATGMRVVRWLWEDAFKRTGMLRVLADVGIRPVH
ncbi:hypothetical protein ID810_10625 [Actinomyces respiraculi]|uniref:Uncharacterized protein n=1 Tax=Actinomyces respiraculi TaxID=2744574 RepID=A0A7T0PWS8_9ACTO|nr:hypothetical protein ID810_10625 [Actinomyces respiraculi]